MPSYATLKQAKGWIQSGYGECDDAALGRAVNTIRQHFYAWYADLPLFLDAVECFAVQTFPMSCSNCRETYQGVTLPRDFQNVEAMWWNDFPVRLQSSWREFQFGLSPECDCRLQKFDMPQPFSTALDIWPDAPSILRVVAMDRADEGKRFIVRGTTSGNAPFMQEFTLSRQPQATTEALRGVNPRGGVTKDVTAGRVFMTDQSNRVIGMYEPDETVPTYRRIKISGIPDGCEHVNIRAARRYFPVSGDDDVVETDQEIAWDAMARFLRIWKKSDKTAQDVASEREFATAAKNLVTGQAAREVGKATQAEIRFQSPQVFSGRGRLNRTGRIW